MKKYFLSFIFLASLAKAQTTFPVNGVHDDRPEIFAFIHANIFVDYQTAIADATLLIAKGKIISVGKDVMIPAGAVVSDLKGKFIYPAFVDAWSSYGMPPQKKDDAPHFGPQMQTNTDGAYDWNQSIKTETEASEIFKAIPPDAEKLRALGFGAVCVGSSDGIARGSAALVSTGDGKENELLMKEKIANLWSFGKGSSRQDYPSSEMGSIALIRQTLYDAQWYSAGGNQFEKNLSLDALTHNLAELPQLFEAGDKYDFLRIDKIGKEFGMHFIVRGNGDEYQRLADIKATGQPLILPLNFPAAFDMSDPIDASLVTLSSMMHWEYAPANPAMVSQNGIDFVFTLDGTSSADFFKNIRKAILYGLSSRDALRALTFEPAHLLGIDNLVGSISAGKIASFIICSDSIFAEQNLIYQTWVQGKKYSVSDGNMNDYRGNYFISTSGLPELKFKLKGSPISPAAQIMTGDTTGYDAKIFFSGNIATLTFNYPQDSGKKIYRASFAVNEKADWTGTITWPDGKISSAGLAFTTTLSGKDLLNENKPLQKPIFGKMPFPFNGYGWDTMPQQQTVIFKNVTAWTNEAEGTVAGEDVEIKDGKISAIGKNLSDPAAKIIDGSNLNLTSGIIDEHSHIGIWHGVNEGSHSITSEVRIGDVVWPDDINIYRQLAGGVTCSHLLHGSANAIGGQTQLIKLRWGWNPEQMKFAGWPGFIKFALGENVKQSNWGDFNTVRFPQTRMGVEQVYLDAFTRAKAYDTKMKTWPLLDSKMKSKEIPPRRDLQLDALAEILNHQRFITCHSYEQSEINMLMHVADTFGFKVNTFTHILEGYKVADKMKAHGAAGSSFADWWAYKYEVMEAIPQNAAILNAMGVVVGINSDDAEMGRRLNQECAKMVKYGGTSEADAWKMVTLNPAKMLHVDSKVGSIKVGKDADLVLWSDNPLSIYAHPLQTWVDGRLMFSTELDAQKKLFIQSERTRLINLMLQAKANGETTVKPTTKFNTLYECGTMGW